MKSSAIAIVGMAGRFPGARNIEQFWQNLRDGVESVRDRSDDELSAAGVAAEDLANPSYVKRASILDDVPLFDASFFGLSPRDASIMDPQHRHFLECAWEALEDAGHPPQEFAEADGGSIGVFAGSGLNTYLIHNLLANRRLLETAGLFQLKQTGNDKDVLATRVSYQLDLRGPSINVQTACSTSLVAVHLACQSLLNYECDMALAGGVTIELPHGQGYIHREGEILSRDGHCRSFDASSSGTVFASGLGIVVLRRLEDALKDRDSIYAVILGSAINNDGARKVGYLAPSVEGQAEVIAEALDFAGVSAADISYVEAHGTATIVGDPIEVRALTQAYRRTTERSGYCGIGSLKSNTGHLDAAAGVAGLIKTALSLRHAQMPPSLHFNKLNPLIEADDSPFYVNSELRDWPRNGSPRRAGVTSLGIGGTNAHVIVEEAPDKSLARETRPFRLLAASAKTATAADQSIANLAAYLATHPEANLADAAFTSQVGRHAFAHRRAVVVADTSEGRAGLAALDNKRIVAGEAVRISPSVVFLFSGQGTQYVNMGRELYESEPVFRDALNLCARHLRLPLGIDLIETLYPSEAGMSEAEVKLSQTWLTQPALFSVAYSLAQWWMSLGVTPTAMVGHSIGEYAAACMAGVFSLEDGLKIVTLRGRLIYELPAGSMLAVPLPASDIPLTGALSLAAINGPEECVVSGPTAEISAFEERLAAQSIRCKRLLTSHAFHSSMMDPVLDVFEEHLRGIKMNAPSIPYVSNVTGTWIKPEEATDPGYWVRHIRSAVRFADNISEIQRKTEQVFLEIGPGNVLSSLARQQDGASFKAVTSLPQPGDVQSSMRWALESAGRLWTLGVHIDWEKMYATNSVERVSLPKYPFERKEYWIEADKFPTQTGFKRESDAHSGDDLFCYQRVWKPRKLEAKEPEAGTCWMVFHDSLGLGDRVIAKLRAAKQDVIVVSAGTTYKQNQRGKYTIRPSVRGDFDSMIADAIKNGFWPTKILHLWSVVGTGSEPSVEKTLDLSFYSVLYLAQALAYQDISKADMGLVSNRMQQVASEVVYNPARAVLLGPGRAIPKEIPGITCRNIDIDLESDLPEACADRLVSELVSARESATLALRRGERFIETLDPLLIDGGSQDAQLEKGGVYLITGGLGGLGLVIANRLAREYRARLILVARSALRAESEWEAALNDPLESEFNKQKIRQLMEIRSAAGGLLIAQADVTNLAQMRAVVANARKAFGKVDGTFHAAGILDDGPLMTKSSEATARVLGPKVKGTLVLEEVLRKEHLKSFVLFSSISSIVPPAGQVDYAAANAFLDTFGLGRKDLVKVINWGPWLDVGMGARSKSPHIWLETCLLKTEEEMVFAGTFSRRRWGLSEHKLHTGLSLISGTTHLDMGAAAFSGGALKGPIEFRDVFFLRPVTFHGDESKQVRVQLRLEKNGIAAQGAYRLSVFSSGAISGKTGAWIENAAATISPCRLSAEAKVDRAAIVERCRKEEYFFTADHRTKQELQFDMGPRWQSLRHLMVGDGEALGEIVLDEPYRADVANHILHPALLDMATGGALYLTEDYANCKDLFLPISYKSIRAYCPIPAKFYSHVRARNHGQISRDVETFDLTLFDDQGNVLVEVESFGMRRMAYPPKELEREGGATVDAGGESMIQIGKRPGISPNDGARAFMRILTTATPSAVVALAQPLGDTVTRPTEMLGRDLDGQSDQGMETVLAGWWQELLGVNEVGLDDDFFSLGGHSLIGVRLIVRIKKTFKADLELAVLFEARTVRALAALIRKSTLRPVIEHKASSALVPIQREGSRVPLFCIHAIGGDVLFYQQLAKALGRDQPFYAFRSALVTEAELHETTVEELARIYVNELRTFYPQGPYRLGGLSFGGMIAYEMAQQLRAQGVDAEHVFLFDTLVPGGTNRVNASKQLFTLWKNLRSYGMSYVGEKVKTKRNYWQMLLAKRAQTTTCALYRCIGLKVPADLRYDKILAIHVRAMMQYEIKPYPGKVTLMRAVARNEALSKKVDRLLGWGKFVTDLDVHDVLSDHEAMLLEPSVHIVASKLKNILHQEAGTLTLAAQ